MVVQNSNYQRVDAGARRPRRQSLRRAAKPAAAPAKPSASDAALDTLTGPIALYPDALVAQILEASKDVAAVQKFAGWLKSNSALKGTELQDAAQKAGFAASYIALAPFPQVVQMMVEKPDWTKQLGAAFTSDEQAVYESIQRLRAAAMALGNLKTTPQQEVVTETSSTGQTIILVQPANPQVVYVPVYNTQIVYVQQAPPPLRVVIVGRRRRGAGRLHGGHHHRGLVQPLLLRAVRVARRRSGVPLRVRAAGGLRGPPPGRLRGSPGQPRGRLRQPPGQPVAAAVPAQNQAQRQSTAQANQAQRQSTAQASQATAQASQRRARRRPIQRTGSHGAVEPATAVDRQHLRLPERRKREGPECEGKLQSRQQPERRRQPPAVGRWSPWRT